MKPQDWANWCWSFCKVIVLLLIQNGAGTPYQLFFFRSDIFFLTMLLLFYQFTSFLFPLLSVLPLVLLVLVVLPVYPSFLRHHLLLHTSVGSLRWLPFVLSSKTALAPYLVREAVTMTHTKISSKVLRYLLMGLWISFCSVSHAWQSTWSCYFALLYLI